MPTLKQLKWAPRWTSHLGCLKGCTDYLRLSLSEPWLFGGTGHAFVINIADRVCPSGPTAWNTEMLFALGSNLGYASQLTFSTSKRDDFEMKQRHAWDRARHAIDSKLPCYGWELKIPEYYVIHGYDKAGYLYKGPLCEAGEGPKSWRKLGASGIGVLELITLKAGEAVEDSKTVKDALEFALAMHESPERWALDSSRMGLAAYAAWTDFVWKREAIGIGMAYNTAVWAECRRMAVGFLLEAKTRLEPKGGPAFEAAIGHYETVAANLEALANIYPFLGVSEEGMEKNVRDPSRRDMALRHLEAAQQAEEAGLLSLAEIMALL